MPLYFKTKFHLFVISYPLKQNNSFFSSEYKIIVNKTSYHLIIIVISRKYVVSSSFGNKLWSFGAKSGEMGKPTINSILFSSRFYSKMG